MGDGNVLTRLQKLLEATREGIRSRAGIKSIKRPPRGIVHMTHRRHNPTLREGLILFLEHEPGKSANSSYGKYVWVLHQRLPRVPSKVVAFAAEFYDVSKAEASAEVNPHDILDTAKAWDDPPFVSEVWKKFEPAGYRTPDGAVVLDWRAVKLEGPLGEREYYRRYDPGYAEG